MTEPLITTLSLSLSPTCSAYLSIWLNEKREYLFLSCCLYLNLYNNKHTCPTDLPKREDRELSSLLVAVVVVVVVVAVVVVVGAAAAEEARTPDASVSAL